MFQNLQLRDVSLSVQVTEPFKTMVDYNETEREQRLAQIAKDIPMHKLGTPEDVAYAALFLASDEAKYITGIDLTVDGGILAGSTFGLSGDCT